jgi:hypothetical protein
MRKVFSAVLILAAPIVLLLSSSRATATSVIDVYAVKAAGTAVRVTVQTGYSFVVEPDAMIPRAAATIQADQVEALASPLDPGDSVDALPGLGFPTAEQDIENGASGPNPLPSPIGGSTPPPQFSQAINAVVSQFAATFNPYLTVPYEHADASYPNGSGSPQRAVFPPPGPNNTPPQGPDNYDFPDLFGIAGAHNSVGTATAGPGSGVADAGEGSAVSIPALGLSIGRVSSHVEVHGGNGGAATSSVVTSLQNVDLVLPAPPAPLPGSATPLLHIGTLVLTASTARAPGAAQATSHTDLQATGVTVAGLSARLDENGLTLNGSPSPLNGPISQLIATLSSPQCTPNPPVGVPNGPSLPASQPVLTIGAPVLHDQLSHHGNERTVGMTGLTLCLATIAPVPNTSGAPSPTPTIYTVTLGDATSSAYGVSLPQESTGTALLPAMPQTGTLDVGGGAVTDTVVTNNPPQSPAQTPATTQQPGGLSRLLATLTGGILSPNVVVAVASMAELTLLATLWLSYRLTAGRRRPDDDSASASHLDLV